MPTVFAKSPGSSTTGVLAKSPGSPTTGVLAKSSPSSTTAAPGTSSASSTTSDTSGKPPHLTRRHALAKLERSDGTIDWSSWYLTEEEDMGQSGEQCQIIQTLYSSLLVLAQERGWSSVVVATDNFFAWVEGQPLVQVSPDVYLVDYPALAEPRSGPVEGFSAQVPSPMADQPLPTRWEPWRPEHTPPRLAVEIISKDWKKDYDINPPRYDHLGVNELVLADPEAFHRDLSASGRAPLVVYRRAAGDRLERVYRGPGPVHCHELDAHLCFQPSSAGAPRVRVSRDPAGTDIVPTTWEKADAAEQKAASAEQTAAAADQKATAAEQKAAAAEQKATAQAAEIASLRARLRELGDS